MPQPERELRSGYTTGACATAATRGALLALLGQRVFTEATIRLPQGTLVTFPLHTCAFTASEGRSSVIKDAGDDPDVTDKAEICALVAWCDEPGVTFRRGVGVGLVTKPGLPVPPGEPAINPVPRQMIRDTVAEVFGDAGARDRGVIVEIAVPRGVELAQKTFNPRLGIVDGISILGTSGIVVPYSNAAWVASVIQAIDVAAAQECKHLVLTVGGRSERFAQAMYTLPEVAFIQIGPFFGAALKHCRAAGIERVSIVAMIGKLAKFAGGNESVHSTASRQDFDFLACLAAKAGADAEMLGRIAVANTAQEVAQLLALRPSFFTLLCERAWQFARSLLGNGALDIVLVGINGEVLGKAAPIER
jgi:cobalt-precorrin-5B (C1)-methyltransferase